MRPTSLLPLLPLLLLAAACGQPAEEPSAAAAEPTGVLDTQGRIPAYSPPMLRTAGSLLGGDVVQQEDGCWVSPNWSVREVETGTRAILVGPADACPTTRSRAAWSRDLAEDESFLAVHRNVVVIDRGTGPDGRSMSVVRIPGGEVLYDGPYHHDELAVSGRILIFYHPVDAPEGAVCAEDFGAQGLSTGYEQVTGLLLDTGAVSPMRGITCSPRQ